MLVKFRESLIGANLFSFVKVGDSRFLRDDEHRHDTRLEIAIMRAGTIARKFNYRIVSPIFDHFSIVFDKNDVYLSSIYHLI